VKQVCWKMINFVRLVGALPLPKKLRLSWQSNLIDRSFKKKAKLLRSAGENNKELEGLKLNHYVDMSIVAEEQEEQYTKQLIKQATRLRVPTPRRFNNEGKQTEFWERGHILGIWYLTDAGISQVRTEIRKELKWRYERRAHYTSWVTALISILAVIIGFVAGILSKIDIK